MISRWTKGNFCAIFFHEVSIFLIESFMEFADFHLLKVSIPSLFGLLFSFKISSSGYFSIFPYLVINLRCHLPLKFQEEAQSQVTVKIFPEL